MELVYANEALAKKKTFLKTTCVEEVTWFSVVVIVSLPFFLNHNTAHVAVLLLWHFFPAVPQFYALSDKASDVGTAHFWELWI